MNWKSTVLVSGAGLLATWLASYPSPQPASAPASVTPQPAAVSAVSSDIAKLADRLEERREAGNAYGQTDRNPFRFAPRPIPRPVRVAEPDEPAPPAVVEPPAPAVHLSGVAMDGAGETSVWTAILSTPAGVVLARDGDEVAGMRVQSIEAESVTLVRPDGSTISLTLGK